MHRVLTISSEDGDPYEAFSEAEDDDAENGDGFGDTSPADDDEFEAAGLADSSDHALSVAYAYAPGDMLSVPATPAATTFQAQADAGKSAPPSPLKPGSAAVPALPASPSHAMPHDHSNLHHHQQQQHQQPQQPQQFHSQPRASASTAGGLGSAGAGAAATVSPDSPRLLQSIVWQQGKVLSLFPWQLRAHFFLSLASTRMYLLMGLWPRTPAVVAAAPRRLRQQHQHHAHHHAQAGQGPHWQNPGGQPHAASGTGMGGGADGGGVSAAASPPPPYSTSAGGTPPGAAGYYHPHAQAQAAAHAYAQYAHGYDGHGGLYGFGRSSQDESQSLAAALSALGRGVPVFLPPEMLVKHGVQEDLMASCAFKPAVRHVPMGAPAPDSPGGSSPASGDGSPLLPRWRALPSLLGRWVARLAGSIAQRSSRAAAKLRGAAASAGTAVPAEVPAASAAGPAVQASAAEGVAVTMVDSCDSGRAHSAPTTRSLPVGSTNPGGGGGGSSGAGVHASDAFGVEAGTAAGMAGSGAASALVARSLPRSATAAVSDQPIPQSHPQQPQQQAQQQPQHAYVECRLYRTDRIRNVSYTCPAVLTVLPSPPRSSGFGLSRLLQRFKPRSQETPAPPPAATPHTHFHVPTAHGAGQHSSHPYQAGAGGGGGGAAAPEGRRARPPRSRQLLRRLWHDLRYMSYGVMMPYKWAPILAGLLSPHMFLLACLPAVKSLGLMGPFTVRLCAYHALCLLMTAADHLLLLRLASELWLRLRRARGPGGRGWRRWLVWARWLLVDGFLVSNWTFRVVVIGILTSKQVELWKHLYGPSFRPHPLLSCCLVLPASWLAACAGCSAAWRLAGSAGTPPTSAPLLLFQEGFLSGLSSPFYSLAYISFAVLGLGGGGVGGGAGGVLGLAAAGSLLPLWLLDTLAVSPLLAVVAMDVLWNMDTAARATPLLLVIVNALRAHHPHLHGAVDGGAGGPAARRRRRGGVGGAAANRGRGLLLGGGAGGGGAAAAGAVAAGGVVAHTSLWMLMENARWWAGQVRDAAEEQRRQLELQQQQLHRDGGGGGVGGIGFDEQQQQQQQGVGPGGGLGPRVGAAGAVARVARAARHAGMAEMPPRAIAAMMAALLLPLPEARWPPRQQEHHARALDLLLDAAAAAGPPGAGMPGRQGRRRRAADADGGSDEEEDDAEVDEMEEDEGGWQDVDGVDELLGGAGGAGAGGAGAEGVGMGEEGGDGERLVRTPSGNLRPLSALEAELRAGQAQVAALRSQLAAAGRGVPDLLLLGRWPPPLELPAESHAWHEAVPHGFLCPITHALMTQPAMLVSPDLSEASPTYELAAIRQWLRSNRTDPTTGRYLRTYHFLHNDNLRKAIEDWVQDRLDRERQAQQHQQHLHPPPATARRLVGMRSPGRGRPLPLTPASAGPSTSAFPYPGAFPPAAAAGGVGGAGASPGAASASGWGWTGEAGGGPGAAGVGGWAGGVAGGAVGRYQPVAGPGPGQRSVCVGTSSELLRLRSPERHRGFGFGAGAGATGQSGAGFRSPPRSGSRGRSLSRGRALRRVEGAAGAGGGGGGGPGSAAAVAARQVVLRAASRQRGLQRSPEPH